MVVDLQKSDIEKFQKLYKKHFNKEIDYETAYRQLSKLVRQMELVYQPITKRQVKELAEHDAVRKADAMAMAKLILDIYQDEKKSKKGRSSSGPKAAS